MNNRLILKNLLFKSKYFLINNIKKLTNYILLLKTVHHRFTSSSQHVTQSQLNLTNNINENNSNCKEFDVEEYRNANNITVSGESIPPPFESFWSYQWPQKIETKLKIYEHTTPTPIQAQALPIILSKRDCLAIARSGSGKSLAFILPALVSCCLSY
jgi:hypothetical protein